MTDMLVSAVHDAAAETANGPQRTAPVRGGVYPVILSGGSGTRLWPLSRMQYPKQLLPLVTDQTMLQQTVARTIGMPNTAGPLVICHEEHRFLVAEQLREIGVEPQRIVLEPSGRNTAAALVVAALMVAASDPEGVLLAQPSDHYIRDLPAFHRVIEKALQVAGQERLVTFGITPARAETGFGYIQQAAPIDGVDGAYLVRRFVEKPDAATAEAYLAAGDYHWNSGIFVLPVAMFLAEMERLQPMVLEGCRRAVELGQDAVDFFRLDAMAFATVPSMSVDNAVMEHTDRAAVLPVEMGWSDIGSWHALSEVRPHDADGNVLEGDVEIDQVRNCYINASGRFVAALGVEDLIVVATDDAVLVTDVAHSAEVGHLVDRLRRRNRQEVLHHSKVYRPWGFYQTVDAGDRFQVKRIMVKPGAKLSLQMHHHRAEHWVVVHGTARITCNDDSRLLHENESTYIPLGSTHRLENPGRLPLHLIEVQSGPYLGEDDIVRFDDSYGRH